MRMGENGGMGRRFRFCGIRLAVTQARSGGKPTRVDLHLHLHIRRGGAWNNGAKLCAGNAVSTTKQERHQINGAMKVRVGRSL